MKEAILTESPMLLAEEKLKIDEYYRSSRITFQYKLEVQYEVSYFSS